MDNCFTFLGLASDYRAKAIMLVCNRDEVPASKNTFPTYGMVKRDGINGILIIKEDGTAAIFGRSGLPMQSTQTLSDNLAKYLQSGVYLGELQSTAVCSLEELSGVVNPNRTKPLSVKGSEIASGLYFDFFDMLTISTFIAGSASTTFLARHAALVRRFNAFKLAMEDLDNLKVATDYTPCQVLAYTELNTEDEVNAYAQAYIDVGGEGAVFCLDETWEAGHKGYRKTKIVRNVTFDLTCVGWEEGSGKYAGKVANLIFERDGKADIKAMLGAGWTHEAAEQMYADIHTGGPTNPVGSIFQVYGLQGSSKGKIRNVKVGELRHDKDEADQ